jgi:hypothetical protein
VTSTVARDLRKYRTRACIYSIRILYLLRYVDLYVSPVRARARSVGDDDGGGYGHNYTDPSARPGRSVVAAGRNPAACRCVQHWHRHCWQRVADPRVAAGAVRCHGASRSSAPLSRRSEGRCSVGGLCRPCWRPDCTVGREARRLRVTASDHLAWGAGCIYVGCSSAFFYCP